MIVRNVEKGITGDLKNEFFENDFKKVCDKGYFGLSESPSFVNIQCFGNGHFIFTFHVT